MPPTTTTPATPPAAAEPKPATAAALHDFLEKEGAGQTYLAAMKALPKDASAASGVAALQGAKEPLGHRFLDRAQAFVATNGSPPPEPKKAWEDKPPPTRTEQPARTPARRSEK